MWRCISPQEKIRGIKVFHESASGCTSRALPSVPPGYASSQRSCPALVTWFLLSSPHQATVPPALLLVEIAFGDTLWMHTCLGVNGSIGEWPSEGCLGLEDIKPIMLALTQPP